MKNIYIILISILILMLIYISISNQIENRRLNSLILSGIDSMEVIKDNIVRQKSQLLEISNKESKLLIENQELKKEVKRLLSKSVTVSNFYIDSIVHEVDTKYVYIDSSKYYLKLPYSFDYKSDWLSFSQVFNEKSISVFDISIPLKKTDYLYYKKNGIFKKSPLYLHTEFDNPNIKIDNLENIVTIPPKKFYEKGIFWGSVGFISGITITTFLIK